MPEPARTIVYRHPCDCDTASRPLAEGEHPEHRFDVDGQPFPWLLRPPGAWFIQRGGDIYECRVAIIPILAENHDAPMTFEHTYGRENQYPIISGIQFPWMITAEGINYRCSGPDGPVIDLTFYAEHVDTDGPIQ